MENTPDKNIEPTQEVQDPGRRRLLKALAAGGVVTAASMVPGKWSSPVLKSGVLPAHAQVSQDRFAIACDPEWSVTPSDGFTIFNFSATATGNGSPLPNVALNATLAVGGASPSQSQNTNAGGMAAWSINVNDNLISQVPVATVTFVDQATYGNASCAITFTPNGVTPT